MAASSAVHTYGTLLSYSLAGSSYTALTEVIDVNASGYSISATKTTHLASDSAAHEYKPGLIEAGEITFTMNFVKALYATLFAFGRTTYYWKITLADSGSTYICRGHISKIDMKNPEDDRTTIDMTVKLTGLPVFAAGA